MVSFILEIQEIRRPESVYRIPVNWWSSIREVKQMLHALTQEPPSRQHLFHSTNCELSNSLLLHDLGIEMAGRTLRVAIDYRSNTDFSIAATKDARIDQACLDLINTVRVGFQKNRKPKATDDFEGSGGVYFLRNALDSYIAVFKPHDEEQGMPNNPKDYVGTGVHGLRDHFLPGQGCLRELAAYILDARHFCSVPTTTLVHCEHPIFNYPHNGRFGPGQRKTQQGKPYPKLGSLQEFVRADTFEDIGPAMLSDFEVQKIALFDMRIINCDRNAANILVKVRHEHDSPNMNSDSDSNPFLSSEFFMSGSPPGIANRDLHSGPQYDLVPIDHGYCLPSRLKIYEWDWAWFNYSHVNRPVHKDIVDYMKSLDIESLIREVTSHVPLSEDSIFLLRVSHYFLLCGIKAGLTLKDLASLMARCDDETVPSKLEEVIDQAEQNAYRAIELKTSHRSHGLIDREHTRMSLSRGASSGTEKDVVSSLTDASSPAGDDYSLEDYASSERVSPSAAVNLSPKRPQLLSSTSCSNFSRLSHRSVSGGEEALSHPTERELSAFRIVPRCTAIGTPRLNSTTLPLSLETIIEKRERGLSNLSNSSVNESSRSSNDLAHCDALMNSSLEELAALEEKNDSCSPSNFKYTPSAMLDLDKLPVASVDLEGAPLRAQRSLDGFGMMKSVIYANPAGMNDVHTHLASRNNLVESNVKKLDSHNTLLTLTRDADAAAAVQSSSSTSQYARSAAIQIPQPPKERHTSLTENSPDSSLCFPHPYGSPHYKKAISLSPPDSDGDGIARCPQGLMSDTFHDMDESLPDAPPLADISEPPSLELPDDLYDVALQELVPLSRVVSFSGFESKPLYDNPTSKALGNLRLERRKTIADSKEFKQLRFDFAQSQILVMINRIATKKTTAH